MKNFIQQVLKKNAYFILAAAWLFTIAFIITNYWSNTTSVSYIHHSIESYIQQQEKDFENSIRDTALMQRLAQQRYSGKELEMIVQKPYSLFLYEADEFGSVSLIFWSSQQVLPDAGLLNDAQKNKLVRLTNGEYEYISREITLSKGKKLLAVALIPVRKEYFIQVNNLKKEFVIFPDAEKSVSISVTPTDYPVKSSQDITLFYLQPKSMEGRTELNWLSLTLIITGVVFLLLFIYNFALYIVESSGYIQGILVFAGIILLVRAFTYIFPVIGLRQYDLFDPGLYSSGFILSSLGDLLINSLLACWVVLFIKRVTENKTFAPLKNTPWRWPVLVTTCILLVAVTFALSGIVQSLISDARISFNVTNFFSLDVYSLVGFIILAAIAFGYFFFSQIVVKVIAPLTEGIKYILYVLVAISGLLLLSFLHNGDKLELNLYVLAWLLGYTWLLDRKIFAGFYSRFYISEVLFWLFIFSLSISVIIIYENHKIELEQRTRTAEKLAMQADPSSEKLLSIVLTYFDNDFLAPNFDRFRTRSSNAYLKDSLINKNFSAYLNIYDTKIYTFDSAQKALYNDEPVSFDTLNTIFRIEGNKTSFEGLRSFEKSFDKFAYIFMKEVKDTSGVTIGYFFVLSNPKRYKSDALVPELFRQKREFLPDYSPTYSYAVYNNGELIDYYNDYPFPVRLSKAQMPSGEFSRQKKNGYDELWFKEGDKVVIFAKKDNYLLEGITLFAYTFTAFLFLIFIFRIITLLIRSRLRLSVIRQYWQWNIRMQIHGTIIFISLFSFIVIGVSTIFFFNNRYEKNNQDRLSKTIQVMSMEIQEKLGEQAINRDAANSEDLERLINEVAEIHGTDINLYDLDGNLQVSSNPFVYFKGILSMKMNPLAYYYMSRDQLIQYVDNEKMGDVSYQSIYSPIRAGSGRAYAYLNIPSFDSQAELKREISNFLVTLINLNAFIFLIAGVIALFIANRITDSFTLIGDKMRQINLGRMNEEITWKRDDEIGGLVKEYNKMVGQLGESAAALAKSEREGAWREMARQVAHEIKNPLTPMKLSIQYLQKAIDNNSDNVKELTSGVARTLIEQIEHLAKIASDFSQFANIGNVKNELFDLHDLLSSLSSLYESIEHLTFEWKPVHQRVWIMADKTQLNRLFTNLFQNALEAGTQKEQRLITVIEELTDQGTIIIKVSDNGSGIPEIMQSKIFIPNFTTKSSGTGLGLAMSKSIVEQVRGKIWFETKVGEGTTFYVELPVSRA